MLKITPCKKHINLHILHEHDAKSQHVVKGMKFANFTRIVSCRPMLFHMDF